MYLSFQYTRSRAERMSGYRRIFPPNHEADLGSKSKGDTMRRRRGGGKTLYGNVGHNQGFDSTSKFKT